MARRPRTFTPPTPPSLGTGRPPPPVEVTPEQHEERLAFVEALFLSGMPTSKIVQVCAQPAHRTDKGQLLGLGIGRTQVVKLVTEVRARYADDYKTREQYRRTDQLARLHNHVARMASSGAVPWSSVVSTEKLIAEVEGNLAPRRLEIDVPRVNDALAAVISRMTPEELERALAEERERDKRLAAIETTGEASPGA